MTTAVWETDGFELEEEIVQWLEHTWRLEYITESQKIGAKNYISYLNLKLTFECFPVSQDWPILIH